MRCFSVFLPLLTLASLMTAQSREPYPNAVADRLIHAKTPMALPLKGLVFNDPDFGSQMVRVTDENADFIHPGGSFLTDGTGQQNEWNADTSKFWVSGKGGRIFAFGFDPSTMAVTSLPQAKPGQGFLVPLNGPTFSNVDPDLIYGTTNNAPLSIP